MIKVGVLRGGPSAEHKVSLKTGESVLANLPPKYLARDIVLSKSGDWIFRERFSHPEKIFREIDVVFNALHGAFGEDGEAQRIFESFSIPYTGSGVLASAIGMNKILAREIFMDAGLLVPQAVVGEGEETESEFAKRVTKTMSPPWVVKPAASGSSMGVSIVNNFHDLVGAIKNARDYSQKIIVEEFIKGREATCGVIENFRGKEHYALPTIEIIPPQGFEFFDYNAKYSGQTSEICPSGFDYSTKRTIEYMAITAHQAIGCRHYSRSDFIVSKRGIYILEINTLPGLTRQSLLPKSLEVVGLSYSGFLDHLISLALQ